MSASSAQRTIEIHFLKRRRKKLSPIKTFINIDRPESHINHCHQTSNAHTKLPSAPGLDSSCGALNSREAPQPAAPSDLPSLCIFTLAPAAEERKKHTRGPRVNPPSFWQKYLHSPGNPWFFDYSALNTSFDARIPENRLSHREIHRGPVIHLPSPLVQRARPAKTIKESRGARCGEERARRKKDSSINTIDFIARLKID